jgi:hypothetical protein
MGLSVRDEKYSCQSKKVGEYFYRSPSANEGSLFEFDVSLTTIFDEVQNA